MILGVSGWLIRFAKIDEFVVDGLVVHKDYLYEVNLLNHRCLPGGIRFTDGWYTNRQYRRGHEKKLGRRAWTVTKRILIQYQRLASLTIST